MRAHTKTSKLSTRRVNWAARKQIIGLFYGCAHSSITALQDRRLTSYALKTELFLDKTVQ